MNNLSRISKITDNTISAIGVLDLGAINKLELNLTEMLSVLDKQSIELVCQVEDTMSIQSKLIEYNCLDEIEMSLNEILSSSVNDSCLNDVKSLISSIDTSIAELEAEVRRANQDTFNSVYKYEVSKNAFIEFLKKNNTKANILFNGDKLRQSLLGTFISKDSGIMSYEKDKMVSSVITYIDFAEKRYKEHIENINSLLDVIDNTKDLIISCSVAKSVLIECQGKDYLLSRTPAELTDIIHKKISEVI